MRHSIIIITLISYSLFACGKKAGFTDPVPEPPVNPPVTDTVPSLTTARSWLVDKNATEQTAALFYNLKKAAKTKILFGHQDDTKRGYGWKNEQNDTYQPEKSDVKEVTGAYPAVYGSDFLHITSFQQNAWFEYEKTSARNLAIDAYNRGGVNTFCWHYSNPVSKGSFYWADSPVEAVSKILPGGSHNDVFKGSLKIIADFAKTLIGADGKLVPVIFRPFHEFDGDWFWWGKAHCSAADYKTLYQFTVTYLRDSLGVRNFMYAWSPDKNFNSEAEYLDRYPGDAYVDLVGTDNYGDLMVGVAPAVAANKLALVSAYAKKKNKVAALTETGLANLTKTDWYTQQLLKALQQQSLELAYVLVWANTTDTYWTPYKGHAAAADFMSFKNSPYLLFGDKVPAMYQLK